MPRLLIVLLLPLAAHAHDGPVFVARNLAGKEVRGPLASLSADELVLGAGVRKKVPAAELLWLRVEGAKMPPLPAEEHLVLASGGRIPAEGLKLDGEKLSFKHDGLGGVVTVPLASVRLIWRTAPDRAASGEAVLRRILAGKRSTDVILLRNGDSLEGNLSRLGASAEVEKAGKRRSVPWTQVSAVAFNTELAERPKPLPGAARVVLSGGERLTVTGAAVADGFFTARTPFGAKLSVSAERLVSLEPRTDRAVILSTLKPSKYEYFPYLDESSLWSADATEAGGDLRVGGSSWAEGVGLRAHSRIEYAVAGHDRFEALIGLDDVEGRRGKARVRLLLDGKPAEEHELAWGRAPARVALPLGGAKTLTVEVLAGGAGPVRTAVNVVDARLIRVTSR